MHSKEPPLLPLCMVLLPLVVGVLFTGAAQATPAAVACRPVTGVDLALAPPSVYPAKPVRWIADSQEVSPPLTYTWAFGHGSARVDGVVASNELRASHACAVTGGYAFLQP